MADPAQAPEIAQVSDRAQGFSDGLNDTLTLTGKHAALQVLQIEHIEALNQAAADGELWNLHYTNVPNAQQMQEVVAKALLNKKEGIELPFIVRRLSDAKIVGSTRYYFIKPTHRNLSIGYTWYAQSAQRTAINTECKLLLLQHAFENLKCISVQWHVDDQNVRSQAAVKRLGAKLEGVLRNHKIMPDGRYRHTHCYSMLDNEWPAAKDFLTERLAQCEE